MLHYRKRKSNLEDLRFNIKIGDLLNESGDILLCPVSKNFSPSNPLAQEVLKKEGKWLEEKLQNFCEASQTKKEIWIGSRNVAFLPCRELKYRGILFVCMDFNSEDRLETNKKRIGQALRVASKHCCRRLSCPEDFLYTGNKEWWSECHAQLDDMIQHLGDEIPLAFVIDFVVQENPQNESTDFLYHIVQHEKFHNECFPNCASILPHYREEIRKNLDCSATAEEELSYLVREDLSYAEKKACSLSDTSAKKLRRLLTEELSETESKELIIELWKEIGAPELYELWSAFEYELPWNFHKYYATLRKASDISKLEKRIIRRREGKW